MLQPVVIVGDLSTLPQVYRETRACGYLCRKHTRGFTLAKTPTDSLLLPAWVLPSGIDAIRDEKTRKVAGELQWAGGV